MRSPHAEFGVGDFFRTFRVSEQVDATQITADYRDGVLTLHLPKAAAAKPRKIAVQARVKAHRVEKSNEARRAQRKSAEPSVFGGRVKAPNERASDHPWPAWPRRPPDRASPR